MAPRLDEDGRCILTGLKPAECACKDHRNSPDLLGRDLSGLQVAKQIDAIYSGHCALEPRHEIKVGDEIWLITPTDGGEPVGWVCDKCAAAVING
jgi:hypothetical protein